MDHSCLLPYPFWAADRISWLAELVVGDNRSLELLLTQATVVVELFGAGYVASSFALYAQRRLKTTDYGDVKPVAGSV
jgi:hypothetical protein